MHFTTRHIGHISSNHARIIELTIEPSNGSYSITEIITDLAGNVNPNLIAELRELANELEEHNLKRAKAMNNTPERL